MPRLFLNKFIFTKIVFHIKEILLPLRHKLFLGKYPLTMDNHPQKTQSRPKTDEQYNAERAKYRKQVDTILDKIAKSGYNNLTKEEKDFLFNTSKKKNW